MAAPWTPNSWRSKPVVQVPEYDGMPYATPSPALADVENKLRSFPPLVFATEVNALKGRLAKVCEADSFLFQGFLCAQRVNVHSAHDLRALFRIFGNPV